MSHSLNIKQTNLYSKCNLSHNKKKKTLCFRNFQNLLAIFIKFSSRKIVTHWCYIYIWCFCFMFLMSVFTFLFRFYPYSYIGFGVWCDFMYIVFWCSYILVYMYSRVLVSIKGFIYLYNIIYWMFVMLC